MNYLEKWLKIKTIHIVLFDSFNAKSNYNLNTFKTFSVFSHKFFCYISNL